MQTTNVNNDKKNAERVRNGRKKHWSHWQELHELIEAENLTEEFVRSMRNPNTVQKTTADVNKIEQWLLSKNESRDLCDVPPAEINNYLAHFL